MADIPRRVVVVMFLALLIASPGVVGADSYIGASVGSGSIDLGSGFDESDTANKIFGG